MTSNEITNNTTSKNVPSYCELNMSCCYTLDLQNTRDDDALSMHTLKIMAVITQMLPTLTLTQRWREREGGWVGEGEKKGGREGGREREREREGGREVGREGGREGGRERERERGSERGSERGREREGEGGREGENSRY